MTRHRTRAEWEEEILQAAAGEIDTNGYPNLTMDAIVARIDLSKGGVYRFYKNKREVALALVHYLHDRLLDFDLQEVLAGNLPLTETLFRLLVDRFWSDESQRYQRVWLQLVPEVLHDEDFRQELHRLHVVAQQKYGAVIEGVVSRDHLVVHEGFNTRLPQAMSLGIALLEGLTLQAAATVSREEQARQLKLFLEVMVHDALEAGGSHG